MVKRNGGNDFTRIYVDQKETYCCPHEQTLRIKRAWKKKDILTLLASISREKSDDWPIFTHFFSPIWTISELKSRESYSHDFRLKYLT